MAVKKMTGREKVICLCFALFWILVWAVMEHMCGGNLISTLPLFTFIFLVGLVVYFFSIFILWAIEIIRRRPDGPHTEYSETGQVVEEGVYKNGKFDGLRKSYCKNGQVEIEAMFKNGKQEGVSKLYHENGQLMSEAVYKGGELYGLVREFYENGKLKKEGVCRGGKLEGRLKEYDENGDLKHEKTGEVSKIDIKKIITSPLFVFLCIVLGVLTVAMVLLRVEGNLDGFVPAIKKIFFVGFCLYLVSKTISMMLRKLQRKKGKP